MSHPFVNNDTSRPPNLMSLDYDYSNLDPSVRAYGSLSLMCKHRPAIINMLGQEDFRGKTNLEQLIAEGFN